MKINTPNRGPRTAEGGAAVPGLTPLAVLRRHVCACLLWENVAYTGGVDTAKAISAACMLVTPAELSALAIEARTRHNLRHVPLLLARELARHPGVSGNARIVADTLAMIIQRPDELTEFLAIYWKDGKQPVTRQIKHGLARALRKFDEYQLAKYDRPGAVRLRDVLRLIHAKPATEEQAVLWKHLVEGELTTPDTWETALSAGADKRATFTRLLAENRLGYLALLRNLRGMLEVGVDAELISAALATGAAAGRADRVLPFRFIAAARYAPALEQALDKAMLVAGSKERRPLIGKTTLLVDVSGSMMDRLSARSDLTRLDAACGLAIALSASCPAQDFTVVTFSNNVVHIPSRKGMALRDAIVHSQPHGSTQMGAAIQAVQQRFPDTERLIVLTDEQAHDRVGSHNADIGYMINVSTEANAVGFGDWVRINGFSESVISFIAEHERGM